MHAMHKHHSVATCRYKMCGPADCTAGETPLPAAAAASTAHYLLCSVHPSNHTMNHTVHCNNAAYTYNVLPLLLLLLQATTEEPQTICASNTSRKGHVEAGNCSCTNSNRQIAYVGSTAKPAAIGLTSRVKNKMHQMP